MFRNNSKFIAAINNAKRIFPVLCQQNYFFPLRSVVRKLKYKHYSLVIISLFSQCSHSNITLKIFSILKLFKADKAVIVKHSYVFQSFSKVVVTINVIKVSKRKMLTGV